MAGNGTIGLELVEELDGIDTVLVPWGGGGLTTGIASALAPLSPRRGCRVRARDGGPAVGRRSQPAEPVGVRLHAVVRRRRRQQGAAPAMWERARPLLAGAFACSLDETAAAVRLLAERGTGVAEGAGALARRRSALRPRRRGPHRLHRLGRQHRRRPPRHDPGGPHPGLTGVRSSAAGPRSSSSRDLVVVPTVVRARERQGEPGEPEHDAGQDGDESARGSRQSTSVTRKTDAVIATAIAPSPAIAKLIRVRSIRSLFFSRQRSRW